jgi:hypothetical protein
MAIIDTINEIQDLLVDRSNPVIKIGLTGVPTGNRYPQAQIVINDAQMWSGLVTDTQLSFTQIIFKHSLCLKIIYFGKTDDDTRMEDGKIVENQLIRIDYLEIDDICFKDIALHDIGYATYDLTDSQKQAYTNNNFSWTNLKTDTMYNNGVWEANFEKPILTNLMKQKKITKHEFEMPHDTILCRLQQYFRDDHVV